MNLAPNSIVNIRPIYRHKLMEKKSTQSLWWKKRGKGLLYAIWMTFYTLLSIRYSFHWASYLGPVLLMLHCVGPGTKVLLRSYCYEGTGTKCYVGLATLFLSRSSPSQRSGTSRRTHFVVKVRSLRMEPIALDPNTRQTLFFRFAVKQ